MGEKVEIKQVQALRKLIPVGVMEAKSLLKKHDGDLEKSRTSFIESEVRKLCVQYQEEEALVAQIFFDEDYDCNRTVDKINDVKFDRVFSKANYKSTAHDLNMIDAWLLTVQSHGLMNSLQTSNFESIVLVIEEIGLKEFSKELEGVNSFLKVKEDEFSLLEESKLSQAVEDLKNSKEYQSILESYKINVLLNPDFFKILNRLKRNIL